jgi:hypothetical protein
LIVWPAWFSRISYRPLEQIWQKDGTILAVKPNGTFARYFAAATKAATAKTPKSHPGKRGDKGGSDGTRTRDLCRDRAAL